MTSFVINENSFFMSEEFKALFKKVKVRLSLLNAEKLIKRFSNLEKLMSTYIPEQIKASSLLQNEIVFLVRELDVCLSDFLTKDELKEIDKVVGSKLINIIVIAKSVTVPKEHFHCVVEGCNERAINSHTISRANNFRSGVNYYGLKSRGEDKKNNGLYMGRVNTLQASTRPLFCANHDSSLFKDIEGYKNIDVENQEHLFLQNWRIYLSENYDNTNFVGVVQKQLFQNPQSIETIGLKTPSIVAKQDKVFFSMKREIVYICINFTNKTPLLASFRKSLSYLGEKIAFEQDFYFHLLNNGNQQCLIISGFRTRPMVSALRRLKESFEKDSFEFWQKIFNIMPMKENVFFTETFAFNKELLEKVKQTELQKAKVSNLTFQSEVPTSFSKREIFNFFGISKLTHNLDSVNSKETEEKLEMDLEMQ